MANSGIPFIGENGFYPNWVKGSGRWAFQRTLISVGGMLEGFAELAALNTAASGEVIVWAPKNRGINSWFGSSALHDERQLALSHLARLRFRCYGDDCRISQEAQLKSFVHETGVHPEDWRLICPSCGGTAGPDLECVQAAPIITRWLSVGRPPLENPGASAAFRSAPAITDLSAWVKRDEPSHLELAYVGQQMWPDIAEMLAALSGVS
jgi:hypothetical protein